MWEAADGASENTSQDINNGIAIPLQPETPLGLAMLIAEDDEGHYEAVAVAGTIAEGKEVAANDYRNRRKHLEQGETRAVPVVVQSVGAGRRWRDRITFDLGDAALRSLGPGAAAS